MKNKMNSIHTSRPMDKRTKKLSSSFIPSNYPFLANEVKSICLWDFMAWYKTYDLLMQDEVRIVDLVNTFFKILSTRYNEDARFKKIVDAAEKEYILKNRPGLASDKTMELKVPDTIRRALMTEIEPYFKIASEVLKIHNEPIIYLQEKNS